MVVVPFSAMGQHCSFSQEILLNSSIGNPFPSSSSGETESENAFAAKLSQESACPPGPPPATVTTQSVEPRSLCERLALNQLTTLRNCLATDLECYQRYGVPAVGLSWQKLVRYGVRRSVRKIQQSQLPVSSLGWIGGFTGENGYSLPEAMTEARKVIRVAAQVRAGSVTVVTGPQSGHIRSHAMRILAGSLAELSDFAATYGVELALQPMHPLFCRNWTFIHSLDDAIELMDRVNHPQLKLAFGTYHLWEEAGLLRRIEEIASRVAIVSLADWGDVPRHENDRLLPGDGRLPLPEMISAFERGGFLGWYELEVWSRDLWNLEHRDLMRRCATVREQLTAQVAHC